LHHLQHFPHQFWIKAGLAIAVAKDNETVKTLDDLQGKAIAAQIGKTGAAKAQKIPDAKVRTFDSAVLALQELSNGNVEAAINDAPVTQYAIKTGNLQDVRVVSQLLTEEYYGIPTALNSPNLELTKPSPARERSFSELMLQDQNLWLYWRGVLERSTVDIDVM
jgi:ABC-type amino acid transport substrate-binding protein